MHYPAKMRNALLIEVKLNGSEEQRQIWCKYWI
jgi:hypothetical protein